MYYSYSSEAARYVARSLILWDYLISIDDEVWQSLTVVMRITTDKIAILDFSSDFGMLLEKNMRCGTAGPSKEFRCLLVHPESIIYVAIQLVVIGIILVLRVWVITGNQRCILWSFFGLLFCTTSASVALFFVPNFGGVGTIVVHL
ncbi:uncharacterized protein EV420DRAFT_1482070 [Desarmillaria tabescens]|uniref:Uncharacterized protein n=1 Tax=Armillaria tabescens TaxID=1929756 RepID=A0AA39MZU3_ARMTA|nr:uncharacterized protein EV420DRAFT_1482070 [Desarmillaria tabescens]KAK0452762.1 hypothetical protein EV420DRAFT_1482070 [Desarmillaria tabescens]